MSIETCPKCGGAGWVGIAETNDQYDRTREQFDACPECHGCGVVEVEEDDE